MGRQVTFRMAEPDAELLEEEIRGRSGVVLPYRFDEAVIRPVSTIDWRVSGSFRWLARQSDISAVNLKYVDTLEEWVINDMSSPVVELSGGGWTRDTIGTARLFFDTHHFAEDGQWIQHGDDFIEWAQALLTFVRRRFVRNPALSCYDGPSAFALWLERGEEAEWKEPAAVHKEGDIFAIPLQGGGWGVGVLAAKRDPFLLAWLLSHQFPHLPSADELESLSAPVLTVRGVDDGALRRGRWPVVGNIDHFSENPWALPERPSEEAVLIPSETVDPRLVEKELFRLLAQS